MAYTKTTWVDRLVEFASRFAKSGETSAEVTLTASPGTVTQAGTPVSAANMNKIEKGIGQAHWYAVTTNSGNAYSATLDPTPASLAELVGIPIRVKCNADATGAVTLNPNVLGAKAVKSSFGVAIATWKLNSVYTVVYNGTDFILQGEGGSGNALAGDLLASKTASTDAGPITGTLALTGSAVDADVVAGLTYYNTDAKTKRTGTKPNQGQLNLIPDTVAHDYPGGSYTGIHMNASSLPMTPGDITIAASNGFAAASSTTFVKVKEFQINQAGAYRITFELATTSSGFIAYGQIYKNGTAIGTIRSTSTTSYVVYTEDIAGWNVNDLLQVYIRTAGASAELQNVAVKVQVNNSPTVNL